VAVVQVVQITHYAAPLALILSFQALRVMVAVAVLDNQQDLQEWLAGQGLVVQEITPQAVLELIIKDEQVEQVLPPRNMQAVVAVALTV